MIRRRWLALAGLSALPALLTGCLSVSPSGALTDGQRVTVQVSQFPAGARVWLSECAPGQLPTAATGCTSTLHGQPSALLARSGNGSVSYPVRASVNGQTCAGYCTLAATDGRRVQTVAISFSRTGTLSVGNGFRAVPVDVYSDGRKLVTLSSTSGSEASAQIQVTPGVHLLAFRRAGSPAGSAPLTSAAVTVPAGQDVFAVAHHLSSATSAGVTAVIAPAPPAANQLRIRFVNVTPATLTGAVDGTVGSAMAPGHSTDVTVVGPANIPAGNDSYSVGYPASPSTDGTCGVGNSGGLSRGHSYVIVAVNDPGQGYSTCPVGLLGLVQGQSAG